jgi:hypothetical protein
MVGSTNRAGSSSPPTEELSRYVLTSVRYRLSVRHRWSWMDTSIREGADFDVWFVFVV